MNNNGKCGVKTYVVFSKVVKECKNQPNFVLKTYVVFSKVIIESKNQTEFCPYTHVFNAELCGSV